MSPTPPPSAAERRRVAQINFRKRVQASAIGKATAFLPWPLQLLLFAVVIVGVVAAIVLVAMRLLQSDYYYRERIATIEGGMAGDNPTTESRYCRNVYGESPLYHDCWVGERKAHDRFVAAWNQRKGLSTLRDQMIRCFQEGQEVSGRSWQTAAGCAELDSDLPNGR